jgi:phospholipase/carboxylesterase
MNNMLIFIIDDAPRHYCHCAMKHLFVLFLCVCPLLFQAQLQNDLSLSYLVREASVKSANPPLIILLHGYGSNEADLFALQAQLPGNFIVISARAPITLAEHSFQWFRMETVNGVMQGNQEDLKNSADKIKTFIKQVTAKYKTTAGNSYLAGFSQGAMMSYEVGLTAPDLLKGIAPLSGKIFESLKPQIKMSAALKTLKIFIGHGDADNRVAYSFATEADSYLKSLGLFPVLHSYRGMAHSINQDELKDLVLWLQEK